MDVLRKEKGAKIMQLGERIFGVVAGTHDMRIDETIRKTEEFFRSLGLTTRLSEEGIGMDVIDEIEKRFNERGVHFGGRRSNSQSYFDSRTLISIYHNRKEFLRQKISSIRTLFLFIKVLYHSRVYL